MRSSSLLSTTLAEVLEERSFSVSNKAYYDGCAAALEWVTGQRSIGPISEDAALAVDAPTMRAELRRAASMLHGQESTSRPSAYLSGVEGTLAWVLDLSDEPPL